MISTARTCRDCHGWTLVEVMAATVVTATLAAMGYGFARAALAAARIHEAKSEALEGVATSLDMMARELRMAGAGATGAGATGAGAACDACEGIRVATSTRVQIDADINADGDVSDANEVIAYSYDSASRQLERSTGAGSPQPLLRNVPAGGLQLSYFDAAGNGLPAGDGLTTADRRRVHRIDLSLTAAPPNPDPRLTDPLQTTLSTTICLRNR